jgi:hypothetical protein
MASTQPTGDAAHDAAVASIHVVESAIALARAEVKLAVARARDLVLHTLTLAIAVVVIISFVELTLALVALGPLVAARGLADWFGSDAAVYWGLGASVSLAIAIAVGAALVARSAWKRLSERPEQTREVTHE